MIDKIDWPVVTLLLGSAFMLIFRPQLSRLLDRATKLGPSGLEAKEPQLPPAAIESHDALTALKATYENPLLLEVEAAVRKELEARKLGSPQDREAGLVRALAQTRITSHFEEAFRWIYASQLSLLVWLNGQPDGAPESALEPFYNDAAAATPKEFSGYPFDSYLHFLASRHLIARQAGTATITLAGREFLKYVVDSRKVLPTHG